VGGGPVNHAVWKGRRWQAHPPRNERRGNMRQYRRQIRGRGRHILTEKVQKEDWSRASTCQGKGKKKSVLIPRKRNAQNKRTLTNGVKGKETCQAGAEGKTAERNSYTEKPKGICRKKTSLDKRSREEVKGKWGQKNESTVPKKSLGKRVVLQLSARREGRGFLKKSQLKNREG